MKLSWTLFILMAVLTGCLTKVKGRNTYSNPDSQAQIQLGCQLLRGEGSFPELSKKISSDVRRIDALLEKKSPESQEKEIRRLGSRAIQNSQKLVNLVSSEFGALDYEQKIRWVIGSEDARSLRPVRAHFVSGYHWKGEAPYLEEALRIDFEGSQAIVELVRPASLVELCQLQETIVIVLEIEFESEHRRIKREYRLQTKNVEVP